MIYTRQLQGQGPSSSYHFGCNLNSVLVQAGGGWLAKVTGGWRAGHISNMDYLLYCNLAAGRSFNDLTQVPDCFKVANLCKVLESSLLKGHAHMCAMQMLLFTFAYTVWTLSNLSSRVHICIWTQQLQPYYAVTLLTGVCTLVYA